MSDIVHRAIKRIRPCSEAGEEFRDALLWLTVLDVASDAQTKEVVFISNDNIFVLKDEKQKDSNGRGSNSKQLHPELRREAESRNVQIHFFESVESFNRDPISEKIPEQFQHLTKEMVNMLHGPEAALEDFEICIQPEEFIDWARKRGVNPTGKFEIKSIDVWLEDFYAEPYDYDDKEDERFRIQASYKARFDVEFEIEVYIKGISCVQPDLTMREIAWDVYKPEALSDVEIICDKNGNFEDVHTYDVRLVD